jgi:CheY-like chemotaxis protein
MPVRVLIVDDDELSREVLTLLAEGAGYEVRSADSGDEALALLQRATWLPEVIMTDIQMPGTSGDELARQLRKICGLKTRVLAMSGSELEAGMAGVFDGFLLKPFTMETLAGAIANGLAQGDDGALDDKSILDEMVYEKFAVSMRPSRLNQLYSLCLKDSETRIDRMRQAASSGDDAAYRKEAHAIKGGCGMVGAVELQRLATSMEERGLCDDDVATLDEFMVSLERLRRILVARESN